MAVITLPSVKANSMRIQLIRSDSALKFYGGGEAIIAGTEALWSIALNLRPENQIADGDEWFAVLTQLSNLENTAKVSAVGIAINSGYSGAEPLVAGGGQLGLTLDVDGASNSTLIGKRGQPVEINGEFKILTADATSDGSGACTLAFEPALRSVPADNLAIDIKTPQLTVRLVDPIVDLAVLLSGHYSISLAFIESYRPS
ncbi:MAG: hypothetical protein COA78_37050 [Blastopirellula sp.]|nr:MAG: hypothetical protein COA78_37050 [Blastopirellula sp.]